MERRVMAGPVKQPSPIQKYLRRHPLIRTIVLTIVCSAVVAVAGALINWATSHIPGNASGSNPVPVVVPSGFDEQSSSPTPQPSPFTDGTCLAGDFSEPEPKDVSRVPCTSADASYRVLAEIPGGAAISECQGVDGVTLGFIEQELQDGVPQSSYLYCLGQVG
jgi:hypothetical protein